jgi:hypothetical protein
MVLKRTSFTAPNPSDPLVKVAKRLASSYRNLLKGEFSVYAEPYNDRIPIELQTVFTHFMRTAAIVVEEKADPEVYLKAQFVGLRFAGRPPFPAQLHTSNARLRYIEWLVKHEGERTRAVKEEDYLVDEYEMQNIKLQRLMRAEGIDDELQALRVFAKQFTVPFRRSKRRAV